ncbi:autotransporter assembly complex protein TamA [Cognatiluteimonas weifangensis]|uniref:Translocation and assembly module subunit TamA n=1 Tax=Cognatiluteimonas weifangensis TaxID=2303539 RepID=A0A372DHI7_9GAMM|nr:autotransporter assembly complex family protein [Luteimonas weifangensis]RFP58993.1 outer membrane protein assembly factor [Luteimonas weifangensis]
MRPLPRLLAIVALCPLLAQAIAAQAAVVRRVDIVGLDEAMTDNVRVSLSLVEAIGKDLSERRLDYLVRAAQDETREALQPFGYYTPQVTVTRDGASGDVTIAVTPGTPVRVRERTVAIEGAAGSDRYMRAELAAFAPGPGAIFDSRLYEASKTRISRRLAERGYFDADFLARRVEVTRAAHAADIDLRWHSGARYAMGRIAFEQTPTRILRPDLFDKLVYWDEGSYYHQGKLDRLRTSLVALDYFSRVEIEPHPEQAAPGPAGNGKRVPVTVTLTPAKRSIYTAGLSYGSDSGAGVRLGLERRYLNARGHKVLAQVDWAQKRKTATVQYRIPAFAWVDGWYSASLQLADEQTDYIDSRRVEFVASRSGRIDARLTAIAALHVLRERWAYTGDLDHPAYRYGSFAFPSLRAEYVRADDRLYPRNALGGTLQLRGARAGVLGADAGFLQAQARASWFRGLGPRDRLIVRGELGHTFTGSVVELPPSLRFYAGGDRSIRGYDYREVGPRLGDFGLGAKNVITASAEYERYFGASWGGAVFVDGGSAFDGTSPDWHTGVGVGVRWRSPVGPVRLDIARGLDDPRSPFTLNLNIGADL